jgi:hypothetical protein
MPIKNLRTGVPVIGHVKIGQPGEPRQDKKLAAPEKWDHVELTTTARDKKGRLVTDEALMRKLLAAENAEQITTCGGCDRSRALGFPDGLPTRIPVQILYDDLELTLPHRLAAYRGRTAWCVGDGEKAQRRPVIANGEDGVVFGAAVDHDGPCGDDRCDIFKAGKCKPHGRFRFMLGIQESTGGCYEFRTTSWNSLANLVESLKLIQSVTGGLLQGLPLFFEVGRQTVQPKSGAPPNVQTIARVIFPGNPRALLEAARDTLQIRAPLLREIKALEASIDRDWEEEAAEDVEAIVREFQPEAAGEKTQVAGEGEAPAETAAEPAKPPPPKREAPVRAAKPAAARPALRPAPEPEDVEPIQRTAAPAAAAADEPAASWADGAF